MKGITFDPKKAHTKLPLNYYYLTEFPLTPTGEIKMITVPKEAFNSRASVLEPFHKPISVDFPRETD